MLYINNIYMSDMIMSSVLDPGAQPSFHICMGNMSVTWLIIQIKTGSCRRNPVSLVLQIKITNADWPAAAACSNSSLTLEINDHDLKAH